MRPPGDAATRGYATLGWLMLLDAALFVDVALRWELGFGFARSSWLVAGAGMLTLWLVVSGALLIRPVHGLLHAVVAFPMMCLTFLVASTGNPYFTWYYEPFWDIFKGGLFFNLLFDGGFPTATIMAVAHGVLGHAARRAQRSAPPAALASWRGNVGLGLLLACVVGLIPAVEIFRDIPLPDRPGYFGIGDPRAPSDATLRAVSLTRWAIWIVLGALGVRQVLKSKRSNGSSEHIAGTSRKPTTPGV